MSEDELEGENPTPSATGPAGPLPRRAYCTSGCYDSKGCGASGSCTCRGCGGKAHGKGKEFASKLGVLKPPSYSGELQPFDYWLFPEARPNPIEDAGQPFSNRYLSC